MSSLICLVFSSFTERRSDGLRRWLNKAGGCLDAGVVLDGATQALQQLLVLLPKHRPAELDSLSTLLMDILGTNMHGDWDAACAEHELWQELKQLLPEYAALIEDAAGSSVTGHAEEGSSTQGVRNGGGGLKALIQGLASQQQQQQQRTSAPIAPAATPAERCAQLHKEFLHKAVEAHQVLDALMLAAATALTCTQAGGVVSATDTSSSYNFAVRALLLLDRVSDEYLVQHGGQALAGDVRTACVQALPQLAAAVAEAVEHLLEPCEAADALQLLHSACTGSLPTNGGASAAPTALLAFWQVVQRLGLVEQEQRSVLHQMLTALYTHAAAVPAGTHNASAQEHIGALGQLPIVTLAHVLALTSDTELSSQITLGHLADLSDRLGWELHGASTCGTAGSDTACAMSEAGVRHMLWLAQGAVSLLEWLRAERVRAAEAPRVRRLSEQASMLVFRDIFSTDICESTELLVLEPDAPKPAGPAISAWEEGAMQYAAVRLLRLLAQWLDGQATSYPALPAGTSEAVCKLVTSPALGPGVQWQEAAVAAQVLCTALGNYSIRVPGSEAGALLRTCIVQGGSEVLDNQLWSMGASVAIALASHWLTHSSAGTGSADQYKALLVPWADLVVQLEQLVVKCGSQVGTASASSNNSSFAATASGVLGADQLANALACLLAPQRLAPLLLLASAAPPVAQGVVLAMCQQLLHAAAGLLHTSCSAASPVTASATQSSAIDVMLQGVQAVSHAAALQHELLAACAEQPSGWVLMSLPQVAAASGTAAAVAGTERAAGCLPSHLNAGCLRRLMDSTASGALQEAGSAAALAGATDELTAARRHLQGGSLSSAAELAVLLSHPTEAASLQQSITEELVPACLSWLTRNSHMSLSPHDVQRLLQHLQAAVTHVAAVARNAISTASQPTLNACATLNRFVDAAALLDALPTYRGTGDVLSHVLSSTCITRAVPGTSTDPGDAVTHVKGWLKEAHQQLNMQQLAAPADFAARSFHLLAANTEIAAACLMALDGAVTDARPTVEQLLLAWHKVYKQLVVLDLAANLGTSQPTGPSTGTPLPKGASSGSQALDVGAAVELLAWSPITLSDLCAAAEICKPGASRALQPMYSAAHRTAWYNDQKSKLLSEWEAHSPHTAATFTTAEPYVSHAATVLWAHMAAPTQAPLAPALHSAQRVLRMLLQLVDSCGLPGEAGSRSVAGAASHFAFELAPAGESSAPARLAHDVAAYQLLAWSEQHASTSSSAFSSCMAYAGLSCLANALGVSLAKTSSVVSASSLRPRWDEDRNGSNASPPPSVSPSVGPAPTDSMLGEVARLLVSLACSSPAIVPHLLQLLLAAQDATLLDTASRPERSILWHVARVVEGLPAPLLEQVLLATWLGPGLTSQSKEAGAAVWLRILKMSHQLSPDQQQDAGSPDGAPAPAYPALPVSLFRVVVGCVIEGAESRLTAHDAAAAQLVLLRVCASHVHAGGPATMLACVEQLQRVSRQQQPDVSPATAAVERLNWFAPMAWFMHTAMAHVARLSSLHVKARATRASQSAISCPSSLSISGAPAPAWSAGEQAPAESPSHDLETVVGVEEKAGEGEDEDEYEDDYEDEQEDEEGEEDADEEYIYDDDEEEEDEEEEGEEDEDDEGEEEEEEEEEEQHAGGGSQPAASNARAGVEDEAGAHTHPGRLRQIHRNLGLEVALEEEDGFAVDLAAGFNAVADVAALGGYPRWGDDEDDDVAEAAAAAARSAPGAARRGRRTAMQAGMDATHSRSSGGAGSDDERIQHITRMAQSTSSSEASDMLLGLRAARRIRLQGVRGQGRSTGDAPPAVDATQAQQPSLVRCSFAESGESFVEQYWYYCYTCGLVDSKGCCAACAKACHAGHDLIYSGKTRFFCDCGAGAGVPRASACRCLQPVPLPSTPAAPPLGGPSHLLTTTVRVPNARWPMGDPLQLAWSYDPQQPDAAMIEAWLQGRGGSPSASGLHLLLDLPSGVWDTVSASSSPVQGSSGAGPIARTSQLRGMALNIGSGVRMGLVTSDASAAARMAALVQAACAALVTAAACAMGMPARTPLATSRQPSSLLPAHSGSIAAGSGLSEGQQQVTAGPTILSGASANSEDAARVSFVGVGLGGSSGLAQAGSAADAQSSISISASKTSSVVRLQRIVRIGNLEGRNSGGHGEAGGTHLPAEHAEAVANGAAQRNVVSISAATGLLAVARGTYVGFLDVDQHISELLAPALAPNSSTPGTTRTVAAQKAAYSLLHRHNARFPIMSLAFDPLVSRHLLVAGLREAQVWRVGPDGRITDRLPLHLPRIQLGGLATAWDAAGGAVGAGGGMADTMVVKVEWVPGTDTWVALTTAHAVYLYDLTQSEHHPAFSVQATHGQHRDGMPELIASSAILSVLAGPPDGPSHQHTGSANHAGGAQQNGASSSGGHAVVILPARQLHALLLTRDAELFSVSLPVLESGVVFGSTSTVLYARKVDGLAAAVGRALSGPRSGIGLGYCPFSQLLLLSISGTLALPAVGGSSSSSTEAAGAPSSSSPPGAAPPLPGSGAVTEMLFTARYDAAHLTLVACQPLVLTGAALDTSDSDLDSPSRGSQARAVVSALSRALPSDLGLATPSSAQPAPEQKRAPDLGMLSCPIAPAARLAINGQPGSSGMLCLCLKDTPHSGASTSAEGSSNAVPAALVGLLPEARQQANGALLELQAQPISLHSSSGPDACVDGVAYASCPVSHQTLLVLVCSKGSLHFYLSPALPHAPLLEPLATIMRAKLESTDSSSPTVTSRTRLAEGTAGSSSGVGLATGSDEGLKGMLQGRRRLAWLPDVSILDEATYAGTGDSSSTEYESNQGVTGSTVAPASDASKLEVVMLPERCEVVSGRIRFSGEISHAGGSSGVVRLLCDPSNLDTYLDAPSRGAFKLILTAPDANTVIVAVKVLLGATGDRCVPSSLHLCSQSTASSTTPQALVSAFGNNMPVTPGAPTRRWYQLTLPPHQALAAHPDVVLVAGAPADSTAHVRIHHLQVFAQPRDHVAAQARQRKAAPAPAPAALLPVGAASTSLAAACHPQLQLIEVLAAGKRAGTASSSNAMYADATPGLTGEVQMVHAVSACVDALASCGAELGGTVRAAAQQLALSVLAPELEPAGGERSVVTSGTGGAATGGGSMAPGARLEQIAWGLLSKVVGEHALESVASGADAAAAASVANTEEAEADAPMAASPSTVDTDLSIPEDLPSAEPAQPSSPTAQGMSEVALWLRDSTRLARALQVLAQLAPQAGLLQALDAALATAGTRYSAWRVRGGDAPPAAVAWQHADTWVALRAISSVLSVSSVRPWHLVRFLVAGQLKWEADVCRATSTATAGATELESQAALRAASANTLPQLQAPPALLVPALLLCTQQALYHMQEAYAAPALPAALVTPVLQCASHCLVALATAAQAQPSLLDVTGLVASLAPAHAPGSPSPLAVAGSPRLEGSASMPSDGLAVPMGAIAAAAGGRSGFAFPAVPSSPNTEPADRSWMSSTDPAATAAHSGAAAASPARAGRASELAAQAGGAAAGSPRSTASPRGAFPAIVQLSAGALAVQLISSGVQGASKVLPAALCELLHDEHWPLPAGASAGGDSTVDDETIVSSECVHEAKAELYADVAHACAGMLLKSWPGQGHRHGSSPGLEAALQLLYVAPGAGSLSQEASGEAAVLARGVFVQHLATPLLGCVVRLREQLAAQPPPPASATTTTADSGGGGVSAEAGISTALAGVPVRHVCALLQLAAYLFGDSPQAPPSPGVQPQAESEGGASALSFSAQLDTVAGSLASGLTLGGSMVVAELAVQTRALSDQLLASLVSAQEHDAAERLFKAVGSKPAMPGTAGSQVPDQQAAASIGEASVHVGFQALLSPQDMLSPALTPGDLHKPASTAPKPGIALCKAAVRCAAALARLQPSAADGESVGTGAGTGPSRQSSVLSGITLQSGPWAQGQPRLQLEASLSLSLAHSLPLSSGEPSPAAGVMANSAQGVQARSAQVLSAALSLKALHSVRREIRALLTLVARDGRTWQQEAAEQTVARHAQRLGTTIHALQAHPDDWPLLCSLVAVLADLEPAVACAPAAWVTQCASNPLLLQQLVQHSATVMAVHPVAARTALQLVCRALTGLTVDGTGAPAYNSGAALPAGSYLPPETETAAASMGLDTAWLGLPLPAQPLPQLLQALRHTHLYALASTYLLCGWDEAVRITAADVLRALWRRPQPQERRQLLLLLLDLLPSAPRVGDVAKQVVDLVVHMLSSCSDLEQPAPGGLSGAAAPAPPTQQVANRLGLGGGGIRTAVNAAGAPRCAVKAGGAAAAGRQLGNSSHSAAKSGRSGAPAMSAAASLLSQEDVAHAAVVMVSVLRQAHDVAAAHPLAELYTRLAQLGVEGADALPLEVLPCAIGAPLQEAAFTSNKLESMRAEARYTDRRILARLSGLHMLRALTVSVAGPVKARCPRTIKVFYCKGPCTDLADMRTAPVLTADSAAGAGTGTFWSSLGTLVLPPAAPTSSPSSANLPSARLHLELPVMASAVCVEVADSWHSLQEASTEALQCPRCSAVVHDRFGICGYCGENAHQCRQCRAINYSSLDGWLCPECGFSRYCRLEITLLSAPANDYLPISGEPQRVSAMQQVETLSGDLARKQAMLLIQVRGLGTALATAAGSMSTASSTQTPGSAVLALAAATPRLGAALQLLDSAAATATGSSATIYRQGSTPAVISTSTSLAVRTASQHALLAAVTHQVDKCRAAHKDAMAVARQLLGVRRALMQYLHKPPPGTNSSSSSTPTQLYAAVLAMNTLPSTLHPSGCTYASAAAAVPQVLRAMLALAHSHPAAPGALVAGGALEQVTEFDLQAPVPSVHNTARHLLLRLAGLESSRSVRSALMGSSSSGTHPLQQEDEEVEAGSGTAAGSQVPSQQQRVADARAALAALMHTRLAYVLRHPGVPHDWGAVHQVVGLLVDACNAELEALGQQQAAADAPSAGTAAGAAGRMLGTALDLLQLALASPAQPASTAAAALPGLGHAAVDCCSCVAVLEVVLLPLVRMFSRMLRGTSGNQLLKLAGLHLQRYQPSPPQPLALLHGQQSSVGVQHGEAEAGMGTAAGADKASPAHKVLLVSPPPGAVSSPAQGRKKLHSQVPEKAPLTELPGAGHPAKLQGSYAQQAAAQRGVHASPSSKPPALLTKQLSDNGSKLPLPGVEASGGVAAELAQMAAAAAALQQQQQQAPFDPVAAAPGLLQGLLRPLLLAPASCAIRAVAVQLYRELYAEAAAAADSSGKSGAASKSGGSKPAGTSRASGTAANRPSPSKSSLTALAGSGAAAGSASASVSQPASQIKLLESLLDEKKDAALLPAALSAGAAGEEVLGVVGECVEAAAGAGAYPLLARLLSLLMAALPGLVQQLLLQEGPPQGLPAPGPSPPGSTTTSAFATHLAPSPAAGMALVGLSAGGGGLGSSEHDAVGHAAIVARLMALVGRLMEFSELQGSLLAQQGRYLVQLVWCQCGLQALQLGRSAVCTAAELRLGKLLSSRFIRAGEEMRRALIRAALAALASLHTDGSAAGNGTATANAGSAATPTLPAAPSLPLAAVQRMHAALLSLVLRAANPALDKEEEEGRAGAGGVPLLLDKAPTQEEFIPGSMGSAPYSSTEVGGPLMRHVKNFICRRLDMGGLEEDDFGMELLVGGSIIDLSLPIQGVYNQVWQPYLTAGAQGGGGRGGGRAASALSRLAAMAAAAAAGLDSSSGGTPLLPMLVTYRLSGLDGEATEPVVKTLGDGGNGGVAEQVDPERQFALLSVLCECGDSGLPLLLRLTRKGLEPALAAGRAQLLQLLSSACHLRGCRHHLLEGRALRELVALVHHSVMAITGPLQSLGVSQRSASALSPASSSTAPTGPTSPSVPLLPPNAAAVVAHMPIAVAGADSEDVAARLSDLGGLLGLLEALAAEAASRPPGAWPAHSLLDTGESAQQVRQLADGLRALSVVPGAGSCAASLARVLPLLAHGNYQAQVGLLDHFLAAMDLWALDEAAAAQGGLPAAALQTLGAAASSAAGQGAGNQPVSVGAAAGAGTGTGAASLSEAEDRVAQLGSFINLLQSLTHRPPGPASQHPGMLPSSGSMGGSSAAAAAAAAAAAVAAGASFRELLLQRSVPASLASYLLAVFARRDAALGGESGPTTTATTPRERASVPSGDRGTPAAPAPATSPPAHIAGTPPRSVAGTPTLTPSTANTPAAATVIPEQLAVWCVPVGSSEWRSALARPGVIAALHLLIALSSGHAPTVEQACGVQAPQVDFVLSPSPVPAPAGSRSTTGAAAPMPVLLLLLHQLEGTAGGRDVAPLAESCLDTFATTTAQHVLGSGNERPSTSAAAAALAPGTGREEGSIAGMITGLREARRARERELAARRRSAMLSAMGVSPVRVPASPTSSVSPGMQPRAQPWAISPGALSSGRSTPGGTTHPSNTPTGTTPTGGVAVPPGGRHDRGHETGTPPGSVGAPGPLDGVSPARGTAAPDMPRAVLAMALASPAGSQLAAELAALEAEEGEEGEEDVALTCCVCREGYAVRPTELLCAYVYCKALPARHVEEDEDEDEEDEDEEGGDWGGAGARAEGSSSNRRGSGATANGGGFLTSWPLPHGGTPAMLLPAAGTGPLACAFSTVTYFNLIHNSCHAAARTADANLRAPKREWDGAALRNGEVRCNNLLPLAGPGVPEGAYEAALATFYDNLQQLGPTLAHQTAPPHDISQRIGGLPPIMTRNLHSVLMADGPGLRLVLSAADLASLMYRFAARQPFSADCGGGGVESNAHLVPGLLQLSCHFAALCPMAHAEELVALTRRSVGVEPGSSTGSLSSTSSTAGGTGARITLLAEARAAWASMHTEGAGTGAGSSAHAHAALHESWPSGLALGLVMLGGREWVRVRPAVLALLLEVAAVSAGAPPPRAGGEQRGGMGSEGQLAALSASQPSVAAVRFFILVDWLQRRLVQAGEHGEGGSSSSSNGATSSSCRSSVSQLLPHLPGMRAALSSLQQLHDVAKGFLAQLEMMDRAGADVAQLISFADS